MPNARILIVDDEDITRLTLLRILQLEGYEVDGVHNAVSALDALYRIPYDVMIVDIKMPGMSGMELVANVIDRMPALKIIVLTAHGSFETAVQALRMRVVDYLVKPASPEAILVSIQQALKGESSPNQQGTAEMSEAYLVENGRDEISSLEKTVFHLSNGVAIDLMRRKISWDSEMIHLTPAENRVLAILLANHSLVVEHKELVEKIYGYKATNEESARVLRPIISRLNKKLEQAPGGIHWIKNVRAKGYLLEIL